MQSNSYLMNVLGLQNDDGEVILTFPPRYAEDRILKFFSYGAVMEIARATGMKAVLVEVEVTFAPTGHVDLIKGTPHRNIRSISM